MTNDVATHVHIRMLGGFELSVNGTAIPASAWHRRSTVALVKLLALQPRRRLLREQIVDALWPDLLVEQAAPRLHKATHYARAALGARDAVVVDGGTIALLPAADVTIDVEEFEQAAERARLDGGAEAAASAAAAYGGDLLPEDLYEPWTEADRSRLRLRYLELLPAAGMFEELVAADPLDEAAHLALVRDHLRAGRRQPALAALDRMSEVLARELGVEPGPEAAQLRAKAEALPVHAEPRPGRVALPPPRTRLIGRGSDLDAVAALLHQHRVVTVTGPGGAGKSTLALAVARAIQAGDGDDAASDVILAELAPVRDADGVTRAVAEAAGVQGAGAVQAASLAAALGPRAVLLVLDNCEHLLDASAELVDAILDAGAGARIIVTSREPLRIDGEAEHRLGSLGPSSAELFAERASAAAGVGIVSTDDPRVIELCERLDGLPLAIELAAAQLRHLTLPELVERLDDRLTLLVGGRPKAAQRHSALTATIEWSYRLLSDDSRNVFDSLGVFPASFDLDVVQAVVSEHPPAAVTNLLGDLVAKSLVVHEPAKARYRLLETIRLFAAQRLEESNRRARCSERLRHHTVRRATEQPRVQAWMSTSLAARSRDDLDNVRLAFEASLAQDDLAAAVDLALGLSTLWRNAVSFAEGQRWTAALRQRALEPRDRVWTLILDADVRLGSGDARGMREAAAEAVALSTVGGDEGAAVIAAIYDAMAHLAAPERAAERIEEAGRRAVATGEPGLERLARGYRMVARRMLGQTDGLREEGWTLTAGTTERDYARYLCIWATSLVALLDRDGAWLKHLLDQQRADLTTTALHENWLTLYWGALALIAQGEDFVPQLRRACDLAEVEGRSAEADCVLALAYAAACRDEWGRAAELVGATQGALLHDTASYIHQAMLADQLVRPRMEPADFVARVARGQHLSITQILADADLVTTRP